MQVICDVRDTPISTVISSVTYYSISVDITAKLTDTNQFYESTSFYLQE
jgi:hypothetical protein